MSVWQDIVGQSAAISVLRRAASPDGSMAHAWLITGPPGSGRSNAALAFAATVLCQHYGSELAGCGQCQGCITALHGSHPDVQLVRTEKLSISKKEVRELVTLAQRAPSVGNWRLIIIEDADRMTEGTFNVLLKAIEEPPPQTIWVLCAPSPQDLAATIRSRCRLVSLVIPPAEEVAALLIRRDGVDPERALHAARIAGGHIGLAKRYALHPGALERRSQIVRAPFEIRGAGQAVLRAEALIAFVDQETTETCDDLDAKEKTQFLREAGIEGNNVTPAFRSAYKLLEEDQKKRRTRMTRDVIDRYLLDLHSVFRDILMLQLETGSELINADLKPHLQDWAQKNTAEQTMQLLSAIGTTRQRIWGSTPAPLALSALFTKFI